MAKEKFILYPLEISKQGEINCFQIKLPMDATRITGVEISLRGLEWIGQFVIDPVLYELLRMRMTMVAGSLTMQSLGEEGIFFKEEVRLHDNSLFQGDFSQHPKLRSVQWIRGGKREKQPLSVPYEGVIMCRYEDRYAELWQQDKNYTVNIYLWYSVEK